MIHNFRDGKCKCNIRQLLVVEAGDSRIIDARFGPIYHIQKNGQWAFVDWFEHEGEEINGAFVSSIIHNKPKKLK